MFEFQNTEWVGRGKNHLGTGACVVGPEEPGCRPGEGACSVHGDPAGWWRSRDADTPLECDACGPVLAPQSCTHAVEHGGAGAGGL